MKLHYIVKLLIFCLPLFLISCIFQPKEGTVHYYYKVTGNATDVTISYESGSHEITVNSLPWQSEVFTQHIDDDTSLLSIITAINNTSDNATLTAEIYLDDDLKASETATGPNCEVRTAFEMDNCDL